MSEPSEEIANPTPDPNNSFYLKMKPFWRFKLAIEALLDTNFSNDGFGTVRAASDSLAISVNDYDNATATLLLKSSDTIEFQNNALPPFMVELLTPLHFISRGFPRYLAGDDDTVVIYRLKGTDRLEFEFVFVDWKDGVATFQIGSGEKRAYQYSQNERTFQGWFSWNYMTYMKEASFLADKARVLFLTDPEQHVLFQFHIGESADLFLLHKARLVITDMSAEAGAPDEDVVSDSVTLDTLSNSWLN
ncbi:uncharacterized protein LOC141645838 isoform X2 [Silene latifolia]|uniref:uncharacterized protein LOC141645838 isoform X2 n=1 Tax=Silene latifolia TaxID=37657 RepID=UPI003D77D6D8